MRKQLKEGTTHIISYWYIPGGSDHVNAESRIAEASSEEEANQTAKRIGEFPPEMAHVLTREAYEQILANLIFF